MNLTYAVVNCGGVWKIIGDRRRIGTFRTPEEAVDTARRLSREAVAGGCEVSLFLQETTGLLVSCDPPAAGGTAPKDVSLETALAI